MAIKSLFPTCQANGLPSEPPQRLSNQIIKKYVKERKNYNDVDDDGEFDERSGGNMKMKDITSNRFRVLLWS